MRPFIKIDLVLLNNVVVSHVSTYFVYVFA
jgi:hypothetical protein